MPRTVNGTGQGSTTSSIPSTLLAEALGYSDSNPEFKQELEKCHSKLGGWPTDADFDFVYTFSYDTGSDRLVGFSCRHEGVTPFIPADAYDNCNKHDDC